MKLKIFLAISFVLVSSLALEAQTQAVQTALDEYVYNDDDKSVVKYDVVQTVSQNDCTTYLLKATTLKWFDENFSNASVWWHYMYVNVPNNYQSNSLGFYFIEGGNMDNTDSGFQSSAIYLSTTFKSISAVIRQIPNQPIVFKNDPTGKARIEDDIIAYTQDLFMNKRRDFAGTTGKNLPLLFPMAKAAKRGLDIVQMFLKSKSLSGAEKFVVSGISKRGWTTWLLGAVDRTRVVGIAPIVFDVLNSRQCLHNMYKSYGGAYSFAMADYFPLMTRLDSIEYYELSKAVDPYFYLERYANTKVLLTVSSSDEFMQNTNVAEFWNELIVQTQETSFLRRLSNTGHNVKPQMSSIINDIKNFVNLWPQYNTGKYPKVLWKFGNNATHGVIHVSLHDLDAFDSYEIRGYKAQTLSDKKIDFRAAVLDANGQLLEQSIVWRSDLIGFDFRFNSAKAAYPLEFTYAVDRKSGVNVYTGFFVNVMFKLKQYPYTSIIVPEEHLFVVSSETNIIPEYYPSPDCLDAGCRGRLV